MKKVLYIFAAVALLLGVASCQKDKDEDPEENITTQAAGVYNPGMKISRIYVQYGDGEKELEQVWRWKDNKLIEIQDSPHLVSFTYQNNRLCRCDFYEHGNDRSEVDAFYLCDYQGANLSKIEFHEGDKGETLEFDYNGNKISSIYVYFNKSIKTNCFYRPILSPLEYTQFANTKSSRKEQNYVIDFTWERDNISCLKATEGDVETWTYTYDSQNNPYNGSFEFMYLVFLDYLELPMSMSKNNAIKEYDNGKLYCEYSYEYNSKGYPIKKITTRYYGDGSAHTVAYYYEYLED